MQRSSVHCTIPFAKRQFTQGQKESYHRAFLILGMSDTELLNNNNNINNNSSSKGTDQSEIIIRVIIIRLYVIYNADTVIIIITRIT